MRNNTGVCPEKRINRGLSDERRATGDRASNDFQRAVASYERRARNFGSTAFVPSCKSGGPTRPIKMEINGNALSAAKATVEATVKFQFVYRICFANEVSQSRNSVTKIVFSIEIARRISLSRIS